MNKHTRLTLTLVALLAVGHTASAQKEIVFGNESEASRQFHKKKYKKYNRGGDAKNSVSLGLITWISGYTPLYYERAAFGAISLQAGIGFTSRNFTSFYSTLFDEGATSDYFRNTANGTDIADNYDQYKYRKTVPGLYLSFSPRIYYTDDVMDGPYIAPMIEYKQFRWDAKKVDENAQLVSSDDDVDLPHTSAVQKEYMRALDLTINFGGHYQASNHMVFGWSTGIGVRNSHSSRLDVGIITDAMGGNGHYANAVQEYDKTKVLFTFQFVVGGWY